MQGVAAATTTTTTTTAAAAAAKVAPQDVEPQQGLECPRCGSTNTKFCYYNNYNLSQPRHFCKGCRRYWTKGGALRNIPVGGGSRKNSTKRSCSSSSSSSNPKRSTITTSATPPTNPTEPTTRFPKPDPISVVYPTVDPDHRMLDITGSFSSLLASNGQLGGLLEGFGGPPSASEMSLSVGAPGLDLQSSTDSSGNEHAPAIMGGSLLSSRGDSGCWIGGWTDLAIYSTPDLSFQ